MCGSTKAHGQFKLVVICDEISLPVADNCDVELLFLPIPFPKRSRSRDGVSLFGDRWPGLRLGRSSPCNPTAESLRHPS